MERQLHWRATMRNVRLPMVVASCLVALSTACGGTTTQPAPAPEPQSIVGRVLASTDVTRGLQTQRFDVNLQAVSTVTPSCEGATKTVGTCCYFAPTPPPPTQGPGSGTPATEENAGPITLVDATSNAPLGTFAYADRGYASLPAQYSTEVWHVGDTLQVSAAGAELGAFAVSAPALIPPVAQFPASIVPSQGVKVTWQPDPNADTMMVQVLDTNDGQIVACVVPDAQGEVVMDPTLYAPFPSGASIQAAMSRQTNRYAQTPPGRVVFESFGWASFFSRVQ